MKKTVLKISMLIAGLIFVFTSASWADNGKNRHRKYVPEKQIHAKHQGGSSYNRPVPYKHKVNRHRPARRYWNHKSYPRNKWIQKQRQHLRHKWIRNHLRHYSNNSYEDDAAYNEFSVAATISEPGVEFSIGTKRTW